MSKKKTKSSSSKSLKSGSVFNDLQSQAESSEKYMHKHRDDSYCSWDEKEALLMGRPKDVVSNNSKSQIFDPRLATIVFERASRVMSQHATGRVQALDQKSDRLKNHLLNLVLQKYIIPGADAQWDLLTKFRMWDIYSMVYGSMPGLITYRSDDDYTGPDFFLIPMRHMLPEANSVSIDDSNYCFVDNYVTRDWLERRPESSWKNIDKVLAEIGKDKSGTSKGSRGASYQSYNEQQNQDTTHGGSGKYSLIHLRTRYERDRWVTFCPEYPGLKDNGIVRDIANPHGNNEIPVVMKHSFPLIDRFYGLGEFERGKTLQYALNSLINLYMDGVKMSIYPPLIYNANGVVPSSLKYHAGAKWIETAPNSIRNFLTSPQGTSTFNSTYQFLVAALLNQSGTTDTTVSDATDPGLGKTPAAVKFLQAREGARDNWDRFQMEKSVEKVMNQFVDLMVTKQEKPINMNLFEGEIEKLKAEFPEESEGIMDVFESGKFAKLKVSGKDIAGKYRFDIDSGTTLQKDEASEHESLTEILTMLTKVPGVVDQIGSGTVQIGTKKIDAGELLKRWIITSGTEDWEKIVQDLTPEDEVNNGVDADIVQPTADQVQAQPQQPPIPQQAPPQPQQPASQQTQFQDPEIAALAQQILGGVGGQ